jgi:putative NIF3 family GTP cyclohydrolase 1 type 2
MAIHRIGVACGSAGQFIEHALREGCELLVTGETNFHTCLHAQTTRIGLLLLGHFASERFAMESLAARIGADFPRLTVWVSRTETDPLRLV